MLDSHNLLDLAAQISSTSYSDGLWRLDLARTGKLMVPRLASWLQESKRGTGFVGFTRLEDQIASFHAFKKLPPSHRLRSEEGAAAFMEWFAILPDFRSKGLSLSMLQAGLTACNSFFPEVSIATRVHSDNIPMQRLAKSAGFREIDPGREIIWERANGQQEKLREYILN